MSDKLAGHAADFTDEVQQTLDKVLPGTRKIISLRAEKSPHYVVRPEGPRPTDRRIALYVESEHSADLGFAFYLAMDHAGAYLKTVRSQIHLYSVLDRTPLLRLEYRTDMHTAPIAHWQFHAERGAFSHLLARAHGSKTGHVARPHDLSSLHLPVGGERFRPCLEDVLQFLITECGVDHKSEWEEAVRAGRERWRRRQLGAAVRDSPGEAARVLRELGWTVQEPSVAEVENSERLTVW